MEFLLSGHSFYISRLGELSSVYRGPDYSFGKIHYIDFEVRGAAMFTFTLYPNIPTKVASVFRIGGAMNPTYLNAVR